MTSLPASRPEPPTAPAVPVRTAYRALLASGEIEPDRAQAQVVERLAALADELARRARGRRPLLSWLRQRTVADTAPAGLYIWGDVGRGKTMLMDLFDAALPAGLLHRRVHFHAFMNDVHERIFRHRNAVKAGRAKGDDPIPPVAEAIAAEARVLCFDEFSVVDIADAMLLGRLFTALFKHQVVVVATSNVEPDRLYGDGLNRSLFLPFVELLKARMEVIRLEARTDYRLEKLSAGATYVVGQGSPARTALDAAFARLIGGSPPQARLLPLKGRHLRVARSAMGVARFSFAELCEAPLGPADFLAIAQAFHTVVLDDVPILREGQRDAARRLILLVDTLYDHGVKLVVSAAAEPADLYPVREGREAFEFQRTASRLIEMRSHDYLAKPHRSEAKPSAIAET